MLAASNFARRFICVQGRESPIFINFAPQKPKIGRIGERATTATTFTTITLWLPAAEHVIARRVDVGSACVDIRQSPKTDVLVTDVARSVVCVCVCWVHG